MFSCNENCYPSQVIPDLAITYFGVKGAGVHFTQSISYLSNNVKLILSSKNEGLSGFKGSIDLNPRIPTGIFENLVSLKIERIQTASEILEKIPGFALSTMQHPIDNDILELANRSRKILSIIHDAEPHKGDLWPRKRDIEKRAKLSHSVITLSDYSAWKLQKLYGTRSISMPYLGPNLNSSLRWTQKLYDIAYVGRGKKYQGANDFYKILEQIRIPLNIISNILNKREISNIHQQTNHRVQLLDKWISDSDMIKSLSSSKLLVLPYRSASQSGWIPIARDLGVPTIATNVGGLHEQFENGRDGLLVPAENPQKFADAIVSALKEDWIEIKDMSVERREWKEFIQSITNQNY